MHTNKKAPDGHPYQVTDSKIRCAARAWRLAAYAVGVIFGLLFMYWQIVDRAPPAYDEAGYLVNAWMEWNAARHGGFFGLYEAFLTTDPGRPGLLLLMAVPGFLLFGPSLDAGILPFVLLWVIAVVSIYDFTDRAGRELFGLDHRQASIAGFFASLIFSLYPMTQFESHFFLVEFPEITAAAALNACALRYWVSGRVRWAFAAGVALALGLLTKVTFPCLTFAAASLFLWRLYRDRSPVLAARAILAISLPTLILAAPFYVWNFDTIIETTQFLASADVASVFGLGGGLSIQPILNFIGGMMLQYEFLLCVLLALTFALFGLGRHKASVAGFSIIAASSLIPFLIVAFSYFKIERYAYPGFVALFVLAGCGASLIFAARWWIAVTASIVLFTIPVVKVGITNGLLPAGIIAQLAYAQSRFPLVRDLQLLNYIRPSDGRDWRIPELIEATKPVERTAGPVYIMGMSPAFHGALLRFASLVAGHDQTYSGFLHQLYPRMTEDDLLRNIESSMPRIVLYKSPPYEPPHVGLHVETAVRELSENPLYLRNDLSVIQPDGSRFILFRSLRPQTEILQRTSETAPLSSMLYNFSDRYALEAINFEGGRFGTVASFTWRRLGPPLPNETMFFHLLDADGKIIGQLDRRICQSCLDPERVSRWTERFYLAQAQLASLRRIGLGLYDPAQAPLKSSGGPADWDGRRAIIEIPGYALPNRSSAE